MWTHRIADDRRDELVLHLITDADAKCCDTCNNCVNCPLEGQTIRHAVVLSYFPLVRKLANNFSHNYTQQDELTGVGCVELVKVIDRLKNIESPVTYNKYVYTCLYRTMRLFAMTDGVIKARHTDLKNRPRIEPHNILPHEAITPDSTQQFVYQEIIDEAAQTLQERRIFNRIAEGVTNKDIADELHVSAPYISKVRGRVTTRALELMRK